MIVVLIMFVIAGCRKKSGRYEENFEGQELLLFELSGNFERQLINIVVMDLFCFYLW